MAPSLPFEIVAQIIENTYHLHTDPPKVDVETLSTCAAVCKRWCSFARGLLFFKINTARQGQSSFLRKFPLLVGSGGLGTCIRSLDLLAHRGTSELDFIMALSYCPNLYELRLLALGDDPGLTDLEVVRLKALHLKIRALSLTLHYIPRQLRLLCQLMAIWPSIQFLTFSMLPGWTVPPPGERPPFSLYELTIPTYCLFPEPIMRWLLPPILAGQKGSLRILSFTAAADHLNALMEYMPHVRSLRIQLHHPLPQGFFRALQRIAGARS
ncbi:hypothetical protein EWM64_g9968 [Hericium alpestre]|uniref:Uncharacterized protein n=1 Tax=Hericium alpestre TaxID=135208 RepID=A0A4Y9ZH17_9AGAM|nr:hypothetical protein EWM64_g9968 [Hericium alpestre]